MSNNETSNTCKSYLKIPQIITDQDRKNQDFYEKLKFHGLDT